MMKIAIYFVITLIIVTLVNAKVQLAQKEHTPVIFVHGLTGYASRFNWARERLEKAQPGVITESVEYYEGQASVFHSIELELEMINEEIEAIKKKRNIKEHHLVCHSMGGLLCRAYLMKYNHTVKNFISTSGSHMGQFGLTNKFEQYLPPLLKNMTRNNLYKYIYAPYIQDHFAVAGFWKDPIKSHFEQYKTKCRFLPYYNGDVEHANQIRWKENFLKLEKFAASGCTTDEILEPQLGSIFSYYEMTDNPEKLVVLDYTKQDIYNKDVFGLKTMIHDGRAVLNAVDGCLHDDWYRNGQLFDKYVLKYLN